MGMETNGTMDALNQAQRAFESSQAPNVAVAQPWSSELVKFLSLGVIGFSCLALIMAAALLWRSGASPIQVLKVVGVISILGLSALLLVVGYSNEQLTPIVGLFGAIAGYLLGKDGGPNKDE